MNTTDVALLLTRPQAQAEATAQQIEAALGNFRAVVISPIMEIRPRSLPQDTFPIGTQGILSSVHGIPSALRMLPLGSKVWCVGAQTAARAQASGLVAINAGATADDLVHRLLSEPAGGPIVHFSGQSHRGDIVERISEAGWKSRRIIVYDQVAMPLSGAANRLLRDQMPVAVPLFSPRSAALLSQALPRPCSAPVIVAALSSAVLRGWNGPRPLSHGIAERPEATALIQILGRLIDAEPSLEAGGASG